MTRIKLRFLQVFTDRHGHRRHYFRRRGQERIALPGEPGSSEFMEAYRAALSGAQPAKAKRSRAIAPGSLNALVAIYKRSEEYRSCRPSTKATYDGILRRLCDKHGDKPVAGLQRSHVKAIIAAASPGLAGNVLDRLRTLMKLAMDEGLRHDDPTLHIKVRHRKVGFHSWTDAEIAAYEAHWPVGTRERLALALLLYTGQRRSDVIRMGWPTYQGGAIAVVQQKTGASLVIPAHPELRAVLDNTPRDNLAFLVTAFGKPFTPAGFTNWFRDKCRDAGLPARCKPHGLRKASARKLAEAGATPHEIKAVTGHESLREVENYTRAVDQQRLAARAIGRLPG